MFNQNIKRQLFATCIGLISLVAISGCERRSSKPNIELVQNMMDTAAVKPQGYDPSAPDFRASLVPPEGTIPRGFKPYTIPDPDTAGKVLVNPLVGRVDLLAAGEKLYFVNCQVCHGSVGKGDGPVASFLVLAPPSLLTKRARDTFKDGYLFHMIVMGRGMMGPHGYQIPKDDDRWALVNYIRHMQKTQPVFPAE